MNEDNQKKQNNEAGGNGGQPEDQKNEPSLQNALSSPVSVAAHQMKNPLAIVRSYLDALISEDFGPVNLKQKEYLGDALENIDRMLKFVSDLLSMTSIDENKYKLKIKPTDIVSICSDVIRSLSFWAKASNSNIIFTTPENFPLVMADPVKMKEVIENLITNAIKYKSENSGRVEIILKDMGDEILFECRDNGLGIPDGDKDKVFSKFYRSEKSLEADPTGSGVGLYIVKAVVDLSGGKIWFEKNKKGGTTFFIILKTAR